MKYSIYYFEGQAGEEFKNELLLEALEAYCAAKNIDFDREKVSLSKHPNGKPYIEGSPLHFNVSHSGQLWICIIGQAECGIDLQIMRSCSYEKISERYFNRLEQAYVRIHGIHGFFELWTAREAYGKFTGEGFFGKKPSLVDGNLMLSQQAGEAYLRKIEIADDIFCIYCTGGKDDEIEFFG